MREIDQALYDHMVNFATLMAKAPARNFKYNSIFDLYLKEGFIGNPEPYTPEEESYLLEVFKYVGRAPKQKACFYNSQSLALGESLLYAEGQVLNSDLPIPLEHGWNALPSGKVVDVTLRKRGEPNTCDPVRLLERARRNQENAYFGLPIPADEIRKSWAKTHMSLMLIEQRDIVERIFEKGYPSSWKKGFQNYRRAPSLSGGASRNFVGGPSHGALSDRWTLPSEKYSAEPSLSGYGSGKFVGAPSLSGYRSQKIVRGPSLSGYRSQKIVRGPSLRVGSGIRASKKNRDWPSPWLSGPEEEWLRSPEREDAPLDSTRSPEGDVPPWAQAGYAGNFPMRGKVFYITAYIGLGPGFVRRVPAPSPVLAGAFPVVDVGNMPGGTSFGSDFMFFPLAAIPIRQEDRNEAGPVVDYLDDLIQELGVFGKILLEEEFPSGDSVKLPGGRWFPVDREPREFGGIKFLNAYSVNRIYGGPHEGGWWFDEGYPVASIPLREEDPAALVEWEGYLTAKVAWSSQYDKGSVLGRDVFEMGLEDTFARHYPEETPRYE